MRSLIVCKVLILLLFSSTTVILTSCLENKEFIIQISSNDEFLIRGEKINESKLKMEISKEVKFLCNNNCNGDDVKVTAQIDKNATIKSVSKLFEVLRELNIKKIEVEQIEY